MTDTLAEDAVSADVPEYPMEREARCPFAPPLQMLEMGEAKPLSRVRIWNGSTPWLITGPRGGSSPVLGRAGQRRRSA